MKAWREALLLAPAWLAIALIVWVTLGVASTPGTDDVRSLAGSWLAQIETPGGSWSTVVEMPGMLSHQGIPPQARVVLRTPVTVQRSGAQALWIDKPYYAVVARWDGQAVGAVGDPDGYAPDSRSERSLLAVLPASPAGSEHQLELIVRGDFGKSGLTGDLIVGPAEQVLRVASARETQRLALALGLSLLAFLPLTVAAGRRGRSTYMLYGLFASSLAFLSYSMSDAASDAVANGEVVVRMHRLAEGPIGPLVVAFMASFVYGRLDAVHRGYLGFGVLSMLAGLLLPGWWMYGLETLQDGSLVLSVPWFLWLLFQGVQRRIAGSWLLVGLTAVPAFFAVFQEVALTHGMRVGPSYLYEASLLIVGGTGAALMLRDARASARHEQLVSSSVDAMLVVTDAGRIADANPAATAILGNCMGRSLFEFTEPEDHPLLRAHMQRARTESDRVEFRLAAALGIVVESLSTPLDEEVVLLVLRDITQRKHIDKSLIHAARLETVGVLLGGIAHDFNNMLGTLLAHSGWLQARIEDEGAQERLGRMENTIDRASQLTRRLLTIARGSSAELGAVDLAAVCRDAVELVEPTLGSDVGLELDLPPQLPPVHGDSSELEQLVVNLLVNARDAMVDGGRILLGVRAFQLEDGARGVCLMVEDTGPGVPEELRQEIFHPFVTTKGRGTGLGLAVATQVARDHHGRIWYEENPEGGARFLLALRHADAVDEAPAPMPESRRVLLVEDERVLLEDYSQALRQAGYDVIAIDDPSEAAKHLLGNRPDILVTDVVMDGLSGIELATLCSHRYPDVPVLLVSGFIPDDNLAYSTWHRLHKPVRAARMVATVGSLRRRAERADRGEMDITRVTYLFPTLGELTARQVGFH